MKQVIWQCLIVLMGLAIINAWQSSGIRKGAAPEESLENYFDSSIREIPYKSSKVQLIYFFAPWCSVCRISAPNALSVSTLIADVDVIFVGLDYELKADVGRFVSEYKLGKNVFLGSTNTGSQWQIAAYPSYVIVDRKGHIFSTGVGYSTTLGMLLRVALAKWTV